MPVGRMMPDLTLMPDQENASGIYSLIHPLLHLFGNGITHQRHGDMS